MSYAGTDIAQGETVLRAGTTADVARNWRPGGDGTCRASPSIADRGSRFSRPATRSSRRASPLPTGAVYDSNAATIGAAVEELGGTAVQLGIVADDDDALTSALAARLSTIS